MATQGGDPLARALARELIVKLGIRDPEDIDIELIAAHHGLTVRRRPLHHEEGRLVRRGNAGLIVVSENAYASKKWRFVIAHEVGHYLRHPKVDQLDLCTNADLHGWYTGREAEANEFAAELLMPSSIFRKLCDRNRPSLRDVAEIADRFETSLAATAIRYVQLTDEPCAVVFSRGGVVQWVVWQESFRVPIKRGTRLDRRTYAGDLHAGEPVLDQLQSVDTEGWCEREIDIELFEHSRRVGSDAVLSFLWHRC